MEISLIFKIAGIGILLAATVQVLKQAGRDEIATLATVAGVVIVLALVINVVAELFSKLKVLFNLY